MQQMNKIISWSIQASSTFFREQVHSRRSNSIAADGWIIDSQLHNHESPVPREHQKVPSAVDAGRLFIQVSLHLKD